MIRVKTCTRSEVHELLTQVNEEISEETNLLLIRFTLLLLNNCCGNQIKVFLHDFTLFRVFIDNFKHLTQRVAECDQHYQWSLLRPGCWRQLPGL